MNSKQPKPPERLPQLNYSLLKENALRKKLTDLGIPSGGQKALLVRRHTEWVNMVNANYDSSKPRTKRELLQDLSEWDRSQGRILSNGLGQATNANPLMRKDFDGAAWGTAHSKDFQRLIQEARQRGSRKVNDDAGSSPKKSQDIATSESAPWFEDAVNYEGVPRSAGAPRYEDGPTSEVASKADDVSTPGIVTKFEGGPIPEGAAVSESIYHDDQAISLE